MFDKYIVGEDGSIVSKKTGAQMYVYVNEKGYNFIRLRVGGRAKTMLVHRVVALEHIPNPDNLPEINHLDGDKSNNATYNLEWTTGKKNVEHSVMTGLIKRGDKRPNAKLSDKQVVEMRYLREERKLTYYELGDLFNISYQSAHRVCNHLTYTHI